MTPNAQRKLTFPWSIGDRALAANLGRTLIPVLFGPFSRHQFCNRASRERPREGARFGLSGEAVEVGALRARCATCSRSSGRRWAMQSGRDGSRPTRTDRSTAPSLSEARRRRCRHGPRRARPVPQLGHAHDPHLAMGGRLLAATGPLHGHCSRADRRREAPRGYHEGLGGLVSKTPRAPDR